MDILPKNGFPSKINDFPSKIIRFPSKINGLPSDWIGLDWDWRLQNHWSSGLVPGFSKKCSQNIGLLV